MRLACLRWSLSFGEIDSFLGGTYPVFLPSKATVRIVLTFGMAASLRKCDLEIAERIDLERAAGVHDRRGIGRLDNGRSGDAVARYQHGAVVDRRGNRALEIGPVDASLAQSRLDVDPRVRP